jgi:nucleoside-diphosphate-sugar epimerase
MRSPNGPPANGPPGPKKSGSLTARGPLPLGHRRAVDTVVVTGVGGSLGQRVARLLAKREDVDRIVGVDLVAPAWSDPKLDVRLMDLAETPPVGSNGSGDPLVEAFKSARGVIHLAWTAPGEGFAGGPAQSRANRRATGRVLDATAEAGVDRLVFVSSATVYGAWPDNKVPLTEDTPLRPNPEFPFAVGKAEAERLLAEWSGSHRQVRVAILRPSATVGSPEKPLYQALGVTRSPRSGDGARPVQYLHVDDLASAVVLACERGLNGVFNVAPDAGVREDEARALAGGVAKLPLPSRVAHTLSDWTWRMWRSGVPREALAYAVHPWVIAPDKLKDQGWEPQFSSEEALVATDARPHWDDLPPGKRQNYNLVIALIATAGVIAGAGAVFAAWLVGDDDRRDAGRAVVDVRDLRGLAGHLACQEPRQRSGRSDGYTVEGGDDVTGAQTSAARRAARPHRPDLSAAAETQLVRHRRRQVHCVGDTDPGVLNTRLGENLLADPLGQIDRYSEREALIGRVGRVQRQGHPYHPATVVHQGTSGGGSGDLRCRHGEHVLHRQTARDVDLVVLAADRTCEHRTPRGCASAHGENRAGVLQPGDRSERREDALAVGYRDEREPAYRIRPDEPASHGGAGQVGDHYRTGAVDQRAVGDHVRAVSAVDHERPRPCRRPACSAHLDRNHRGSYRIVDRRPVARRNAVAGVRSEGQRGSFG